MTTAEAVALAERHRDRFVAIQDQAVAMSLAAWDSLGDWTSPAMAEEWAELWLPISDAAVEAVMEATDGYLAVVTDADAGFVDALTASLLRGITAGLYAARPLSTVLTELSRGALWEDAVKAGRNRVAEMMAADVSLGQRRVADEWVGSNRIVGYRRTLTGMSCALCAVASTQRYHRRNLMPIHNHCDCGVAAIYGEDDPGHVINERLLDDLKRQGGPEVWDRPYGLDEQGRLRRRKTEVVRDADGNPVINPKTGRPRTRMVLGDEVSPQIRDHGEMGRVLWAPGDHFLGPNDLN